MYFNGQNGLKVLNSKRRVFNKKNVLDFCWLFWVKPFRIHMFKTVWHLYEPWSKLVVLGMVIPPLIGNPYNGYLNPYYWVDDHPLLYGNNGSLDPSTYAHIAFRTYNPPFRLPKKEHHSESAGTLLWRASKKEGWMTLFFAGFFWISSPHQWLEIPADSSDYIFSRENVSRSNGFFFRVQDGWVRLPLSTKNIDSWMSFGVPLQAVQCSSKFCTPVQSTS